MFGDCDVCAKDQDYDRRKSAKDVVLWGEFHVSLCDPCTNSWKEYIDALPLFKEQTSLAIKQKSIGVLIQASTWTNQEAVNFASQNEENLVRLGEIELLAYQIAKTWCSKK